VRPTPHMRRSEKRERKTMKTNYAMMEGNATRFNSVEAWWFVDDERWKWFSLCAASVHMHAKPLTEAEYKAHFPDLPPLPKTAFQSDPSLSRASATLH
jgi:hypothetical protein